MESVVKNADFSVLSSGYATFLFALGGVGVTVLTLVLTLGRTRHDTIYAVLVGALTVFTLTCFVGAHLLTEASAVRGNLNGATQADMIRRQYVVAEPSIFLAATLFLFTLVVLPFAYENEVTRTLRPLLLSMAGFITVAIVAWHIFTILFLGMSPISVLSCSGLVWITFATVSFLRTVKKGISRFALISMAAAIASTEVLQAFTMDPPRATSLMDVYWMSICVSVSVGSALGMGAGLIVHAARRVAQP